VFSFCFQIGRVKFSIGRKDEEEEEEKKVSVSQFYTEHWW